MQPLSPESITADEIDLPILKEKNASVAVLRLDKIHPIISGNKWFKLKYYLEDARKSGKTHIATFGGPYSNHIVATAAAGALFGFQTTGIIRGEEPKEFSSTLNQAKEYGMTLVFTEREYYRRKKLPSELNLNEDVYLINEGGYGPIGTQGTAEILNHCKKENYSHIACATATTTMLAGIIKAALPAHVSIGVSVLKNNFSLQKYLLDLLNVEEQRKKVWLIHDYHFGGYAKYSRELVNFMNDFFENTGIATDFVYTAKLFYGVLDMIKNNLFPEGSRLLVIHSGGVQGNLSLKKGTLIF